MTRTAISPRLAIRIFLSTDANVGGVTRSGDISGVNRLLGDWVIRHVSEIGSTNDELLGAAERGDLADRTVLVADHQTAGRGRLDRRWDAPPGTNLLASIYFATVPEQPSELTQRVGLAIVAAVETMLDSYRQIGLKWPNDVLLDGDKLAGILAQRSSGAPGVVVGFGVNIGWAPDGAARLNEEIATTATELLERVLVEFDRLPVDIADLYASRLLTIGQFVRVELPGGGALVGRADGVDHAGRLAVVDDDGGSHCFDVGDVIHLRSAD